MSGKSSYFCRALYAISSLLYLFGGRLPKNLWICIYFLILDSCESNVTEVTYSGVSIRVGESADDDLALRALSWAHHWIQEFF